MLLKMAFREFVSANADGAYSPVCLWGGGYMLFVFFDVVVGG